MEPSSTLIRTRFQLKRSAFPLRAAAAGLLALACVVGDVSLAHQSPAHGSAGRGDGGGATIEVRAGGNLQAALDAAEPGDQIVLEAGATFVGPFVLPNKAASVEAGLQTRLPAGLQARPPVYVEAGLQTRLPEILIRTSTPDASLPPGVRVRISDAPKMARLMASGDHVVRTAPGLSLIHI